MNLPRVSIVTISFNQAQFLQESIQSILDQDYPNLEYILIDGGSNDGSLEIIQKYTDYLTCWISEPDQGQSHAINKGFRRCSGDIITFLGSDDIYLPGTLLEVGEKWQNRDQAYGAIVGGFCIQDKYSNIIGNPVPPKLQSDGPIDLTLGPPGVYRLHQVSTFFSREALDSVGRFVREDMHYVMDRELLYRVCKNYPLLLINRPYGVFRRHDQSKSVASILPFSQEFANLYLQALNGDPQEDRHRKEMAQHHLAKGFISYAKSVDDRLKGVLSLIKVPFYSKSLVFRYAYINAWLHVLGFRRNKYL